MLVGSVPVISNPGEQTSRGLLVGLERGRFYSRNLALFGGGKGNMQTRRKASEGSLSHLCWEKEEQTLRLERNRQGEKGRKSKT